MVTTSASIIHRLPRYIKRKTTRQLKSIKQRITTPKESKGYLFVVGCQRSGTSMMYKTFENDPNAGVFDEISILSNRDKIEGLRFNDLNSVLKTMTKNPASLVVAKPLVESQNLTTLLDHFPDSRAIWMFRPYNDVVSSNLKRFGKTNGKSDIQPIIENDSSNWRAEKLAPEIREQIISLSEAASSEEDAAALFWYARNSLYFTQKDLFLDRVFLCNYNNLVVDPKKSISSIYSFLGRQLPPSSTERGINARSIGKGQNLNFSPEIKLACDKMLERLTDEQDN
jgi:hypothetical protein